MVSRCGHGLEPADIHRSICASDHGVLHEPWAEVKAGIPLDARDVDAEKMEYPAPAILADGDLAQKPLAAQDHEVAGVP